MLPRSMLRPSTGWSSFACAAPMEAKANAAARMVRWMLMAFSCCDAGPASVVALAVIDGRSIIIGQTDEIDNAHRPHQFGPHRLEPARGARCAADRAQRHARRGPRRPPAVGHESQSRATAGTARRRAADPGTGDSKSVVE